MNALRRFFRALFIETPPHRYFGEITGNPHFDAYSDWWRENAPAWNRDNYHDYNIGLVAWLDSRLYWQSQEGHHVSDTADA